MKLILTKKFDIFVLILLPIAALLISLGFKASYLFLVLLFFGLPCLWLSFRAPHKIRKSFLFSLVFSISGIFIDYIAIVNGSWFEPSSISSFRLLGVIPIEDLLWGFFLIYNMVIFYEYFLDEGKDESVSKKIKFLMLPLIILLVFFLTVLSIRPELLIVPYYYLLLGGMGLFSTVIFILMLPRLLPKYIKTGLYFFFLFALYEIAGLNLNRWAFPGSFVGQVSVMGYRFPLEEFLFFLIMTPITFLAFYEFFADDRK